MTAVAAGSEVYLDPVWIQSVRSHGSCRPSCCPQFCIFQNPDAAYYVRMSSLACSFTCRCKCSGSEVDLNMMTTVLLLFSASLMPPAWARVGLMWG